MIGLVLINNHIESKSIKAILLYHVTGNESVKIVDKENRVSYLNDIAYNLDVDFSNKNDLPKLYNVLYSNRDYVLIGTHERIVNISLANSEFNIDFDVRFVH